MKQLLAIWLVPQENDKQYLQNVINDLGAKYNSPVFVPHLTILGDTFIDLDDLKEAIDKTFINTPPIVIKKTLLSQSELFFKTVFIEFEKNEILTNLFNNLIKNLPVEYTNQFNPHISLIYKKFPFEKKAEIINSLSLKNEFIIDKVVINAPRDGDTDFLNIEGWQSLYTKKLNY